MKALVRIAVIAALLTLGLLAVTPAHASAAELDYSAIARRAVDVLELKPGDDVLINTWRHTLDLAEALARECYRAGAIPIIAMDSDALYAFRLGEVSEDTLRRTSQLAAGMIPHLDAEISLAGPGDPAVFAMGSPAKLAAIGEAKEPISKLWQEHKPKGLYINHGFATPQRAAQYGVDYEAWRDSTLAAIGADLDAVEEQALKLCELLTDAEEIVVTTPAGTDLVFSTAGRDASFWKAEITPEMLEEGEAWVSLPTGSVSCTAVETSADGTVVAPRVALWGMVVENLAWEFANGVLVGYAADANLEPFTEYFESATGDKDRIGTVSFGVNPEGQPTGCGLDDALYSGVVSIGIGRNIEDGGENETNFGWSLSLIDATVVIDGVTVIEDGEIVVESGPRPSGSPVPDKGM